MLSFTAKDLLSLKKYPLSFVLISAFIMLVSCEEAILLKETQVTIVANPVDLFR